MYACVGGGGSMGVRGAVLPGDFGGIRGHPGASRGELTERAPSFTVNRTACSSKASKG